MVERNLLCFVALFFSSATSRGADEVIAASNGETVFLSCPLPFNYSYDLLIRVKWVKDGKSVLCSYLIKNNTTPNLKCSPRFNVGLEPTGLFITNVTRLDSGLYNCSMTRVIPPPTIERYSALRLHVTGLILQQINSGDPSCVELLCFLDDLTPHKVNFTWTTAGQQRPLAAAEANSTLNSRLRVCQPDRRDGDTITCHASISFSNSSELYSKNITLTFNSVSGGIEVNWLIIVSVCSSVGLLLIIFLIVFIYKRKKKCTENGAIVFNNKIYENFSFSNPMPHPVSTTGSNIRQSTRPSPEGHYRTEECIYEN